MDLTFAISIRRKRKNRVQPITTCVIISVRLSGRLKKLIPHDSRISSLCPKSKSGVATRQRWKIDVTIVITGCTPITETLMAASRWALDFITGLVMEKFLDSWKGLDWGLWIFLLSEKKRNTWYVVPVKKIRNADRAKGPRMMSWNNSTKSMFYSPAYKVYCIARTMDAVSASLVSVSLYYSTSNYRLSMAYEFNQCADAWI